LKLNSAFQVEAKTKVGIKTKGVRKGRRFGLNPPLELDVLQNFITCATEMNCFRILVAC